MSFILWLYIVLFYGTSKTFVDTFSDFSILVNLKLPSLIEPR